MARKQRDFAKKVMTPGSIKDKNLDESSAEDSSSELIETQEENEDTETYFEPIKGRTKVYRTKFRTKVVASKRRESKQHKFDIAKKEYLRGRFKTLNKCAKFYKVPYSTLYRLLSDDGQYSGSGRFSHVLLPDEEKLVVDHVKWRASVGCGLNWCGLQQLIREILVGAKRANPERITGYETTGQTPNIWMLRRLAERNNLSLKSSMEISKGRQVSKTLFSYD